MFNKNYGTLNDIYASIRNLEAVRATRRDLDDYLNPVLEQLEEAAKLVMQIISESN